MDHILNDHVIAGLEIIGRNRFVSFKGYEANIEKSGVSGRRKRTQPAPGGFGVVVTPRGAKTYVLNYIFEGRERRTKIGPCATWRPDEAITKAHQFRHDLDHGIDPMADRKPRGQQPAVAPAADGKRGMTVKELWDRWERDRSKRGKRDPYNQRGTFVRVILPTIGDMAFTDVRKSTVRELRETVSNTKGTMAANKVITYLSAVLGWAAKEYDEDELGDWEPPRLHVLKYEEKRRERVLTADEVRAIWAKLDQLDAPPEHPAGKQAAQRVFGKFVKLLLLTSQRRNDIGMLLWSEVDLQAATVRLPAERYKTEVSHEFPLSADALAILKSIDKRTGDDRVFVNLQYDRNKKRLNGLAPIAHWTLHDLRRTGATLMFANGVPLDDIDRLQGHAIKGIAGTYVVGTFMDQKRRAADTLARVIQKIVDPKPDSNVVELRAAAAV